MWNPVVLALLCLVWGGGLGSSFPLGSGVAPDVEEDLVVEDVPGQACCPECDAGPERGACEGVGGEEGGCGGGTEVCAHEGAVDDVESDTGEGDAHVCFGAGWGAEGGDEGTIGVVDEEEGGEDAHGGCERCNVGWGCCEGCVDECVYECDGRDEFHEDPGEDAVEEKDAVGGRGESAKGGIDEELDGSKERRSDEQDTSND